MPKVTWKFSNDTKAMFVEITMNDVIVNALIDTGATSSIINSNLATMFHWTPICEDAIIYTTESVPAKKYICDIKLSKDIIIRNHEIFGIEMKEHGVIGMDILTMFNVSILHKDDQLVLSLDTL